MLAMLEAHPSQCRAPPPETRMTRVPRPLTDRGGRFVYSTLRTVLLYTVRTAHPHEYLPLARACVCRYIGICAPAGGFVRRRAARDRMFRDLGYCRVSTARHLL